MAPIKPGAMPGAWGVGSGRSKARATQRPAGVTALVVFFIFGVAMSGLSAISLLTHAAVLEPLWQIKPAAQLEFSRWGLWGPVLLVLVCLACAAAAWGFFAGTRWGYRLGIGILVANLAGDIARAAIGAEPGAWVAVATVVLVLWYLRSRRVQRFFRGTP